MTTFTTTHIPAMTGRTVIATGANSGIGRFSQSEDDGALPTLYAAVADVPGGAFVGPGGLLQGRGAPKLVGRSKTARDDALARRLWTASEKLTGVTFPLSVRGR